VSWFGRNGCLRIRMHLVSKTKVNLILLRITVLIFAALVVRGAHGQTPTTTTEKKSCCTTASSRTMLLAAATAGANAPGADGAKGAASEAPIVSMKGWPAKPGPDGMVWIPGGEFWILVSSHR
jgi:hypothetical protein